jgi:rhodanese-related sulfurtransferase/predicted DCC family thiol-disulfide oxidoreductase YuxK
MKPNNLIRNKVNFAVNVAMLVALATFAFCIARYTMSRYQFSEALLTADNVVHLEGVDLSKSEQNIVVFLDKSCKFCNLDVPFYQRLAKESQTHDVNLIVAFPHDLREGQQYLAENQIGPDKVVRLHFNQLGVQGTPTIMILNRRGGIIAKWSGELSAPLEDYIVSILGRDQEAIFSDGSPYLALGNRLDPPACDVASLRTRLLSNTVTIVDVDSREAFGAQHFVGAVNIPDDELYSRALNELVVSKGVVLFSRDADVQKLRNANAVLRSIGFTTIESLNLTLTAAVAAGLEIEKVQR